jgi:hypothetical protein
MMPGLEETAKRKRRLKVFLIVLTNVVIVVSVGSFLVLSQPSSEPDPYVTCFQGSSNSSCAHAEGTIVNPRTTTISNVTLVLNVYVHYICHHDLDHHTLLKKEQIFFGSIEGNTSKSFSVEIPYPHSAFYSFRYVGYELFLTQ